MSTDGGWGGGLTLAVTPRPHALNRIVSQSRFHRPCVVLGKSISLTAFERLLILILLVVPRKASLDLGKSHVAIFCTDQTYFPPIAIQSTMARVIGRFHGLRFEAWLSQVGLELFGENEHERRVHEVEKVPHMKSQGRFLTLHQARGRWEIGR